MAKNKNEFKLELENGWLKGNFNIYQGRNGKIYLMLGNSLTVLTLQQIESLGIPVYELKDFDHNSFVNAYELSTSK